jgi:hypothetical protein
MLPLRVVVNKLYQISYAEVQDPAQFATGGANFITTDEESSGIIDASRFLGKGTFLFDAQVHKGHAETDKVEYGQLVTLRVQDWDRVFDQ